MRFSYPPESTNNAGILLGTKPFILLERGSDGLSQTIQYFPIINTIIIPDEYPLFFNPALVG